jgi:hypothetical protein
VTVSPTRRYASSVRSVRSLREWRPSSPSRRRSHAKDPSSSENLTRRCPFDREGTLSVRGSCEASTERAVRSTVLTWPMRWPWPSQSRLLPWLPLRWAGRFCTHYTLLLSPRIGRSPPHFVWRTRRRGRCRRRMTREALAFASLGARIRLGLRVRSRWSRRHRATWTAPRSRVVPFLSSAQCVKIGPPDPQSHPAVRNATTIATRSASPSAGSDQARCTHRCRTDRGPDARPCSHRPADGPECLRGGVAASHNGNDERTRRWPGNQRAVFRPVRLFAACLANSALSSRRSALS